MGRELDFETGIAGQNITWKHEEGLCGTGLPSHKPPISKVTVIPTSPNQKSPLLAKAARSGAPNLLMATLFCVWIYLEDSERVAFGIDEISLPAGIRHGKLGHRDDAAELFDRLCDGIIVLHFN